MHNMFKFISLPEVYYIIYICYNIYNKYSINTGGGPSSGNFDYLEIKLLSNIKPSATQNVLVPGRGKIGTYKFFLNNKDLNFIDKKIGETMKKLNYNL